MKRTYVGLGILAALGIGMASWLFLRATENTATPSGAIDAPDTTFPALTEPVPERAPETAAPRATVHRPDADSPKNAASELPADLRIAALEQEAGRGDAVAACRLAAELTRCRTIRVWSETSDSYHVSRLARLQLNESQIEHATEELIAANAANLRLKEECQRVPADKLGRIGYHHLASAQAGNVDSMVLFANAAGIGGEEMVADPALYALYRAHGWEMFVRAFEAGDPQAVLAWMGAIESGGFSFLSGLLPVEWRTPEVARELNRRMFQDLIAGPEGMPAPDVAPETAARADALYQRHFASSPRPRRFSEALLKQRRDEEDRAAIGVSGIHRFPLNDQHCENSPP